MESYLDRPALVPCKTAEELLDMYFLDIRSALLESAAVLDRIERADGGSDMLSCERIQKLKQACDIIKNGRGNRAEQFLLLFSDPVK